MGAGRGAGVSRPRRGWASADPERRPIARPPDPADAFFGSKYRNIHVVDNASKTHRILLNYGERNEPLMR